MKRAMLLKIGILCAFAGLTVPVSAQSGTTIKLKGEVPFAFVSSDRTMPSGQYSVEIRQEQVRFLDAHGQPVQVVVSNPQQDSGRDEQPRLVFHRYGETYILWQIWTRDHKVDFRRSRTEYSLKANRQVEPGTVILAMR